jgi:UDP-glucose 4-epimerase
MSECVLITGGSGFIGTYITERLARAGYRVVNFDFQKPFPGGEAEGVLSKLGSKISFARGDITDFSTLIRAAKENKVDRIIHAAALTDVEVLRDSPLRSLEVNIRGTLNALETARILGLRRAILISSIAVYAPKKYEPMDEEHPVLAINRGPALSTYSCAKLSAESFGMHYWAEFGVPFIAVRCSGVYGFGMKYPMYIKTILENAVDGKGTRIEEGGSASRDFVYVKDVARAVHLALEVEESRLKSRVFNVAHGGPLVDVIRVGSIIGGMFPKVSIQVRPGLTEFEAKIQDSRGMLSIERARENLSYEPQYSLPEGIQDYAELYRGYRESQGRNSS